MLLSTATLGVCALIVFSNALNMYSYEKYLKHGKFLDDKDAKITWIEGIPIYNCLIQCENRKHCASLSYHKGTPLCMLHRNSTNDVTNRTGSIHAIKSDWNSSYLVTNPQCNTCDGNKTCFPEEHNCSHKECPQPPSLENGYYKGNVYDIGGRVRYFCNDGINSTGTEPISTCLSNGMWSVIDFNCTVSCPDLWTSFSGHCYKKESLPGQRGAPIETAIGKCKNISAYLARMDTQEEMIFLTNNTAEYNLTSPTQRVAIDGRYVNGSWVRHDDNTTHLVYTPKPEDFENKNITLEHMFLLCARVHKLDANITYKYSDVICEKQP